MFIESFGRCPPSEDLSGTCVDRCFDGCELLGVPALLVEGWVEPEFWTGSTVRASSGNADDLAVARAVRSSRDGMKCELEMQYVVARPEALTTISERHTMRLSDPAEFAEAYDAAGVSFDRLPHMFHPGRSVYAGIKK